MELKPKNIKLHVKIITPIHIDNWEILDRMNYFLLYNEWEKLQIVEKWWLLDCAKKNKILFNKIIISIESWNFKELEKLKEDYYNDDIAKYLWDEIIIWQKAKKSLLNLWWSNNQWIIKRFSRFWIDKELFIPWSTLKGIFRTIFLFDEVNQWNNYKNEASRIELLNEKWDDFKKELFAFLQFEDININNLNNNLEIQEINSKNKPTREWQKTKPWINQVMEIIKDWEFEINLLDSKWQINIKELNKKIEKYSNTLVTREEKILDNIWFRSDFIDNLDEYYKNWYFPIKIWMFKKSLSYKLFWEEMIKELNENFFWKEWLNKSRELWIWDKMIYVDEFQNPIWWIAIKILDDNK